MSLFGILPISGSGIDVMQSWLDSIAGNIANMNDVTATNQNAYEARYIFSVPVNGDPTSTNPTDNVGQGVTVAQVLYGSPAGVVVSDPSNPLADSQGLVKYPAIDQGSQMVDAVMAQHSYQADVTMINRATESYKSALTLGS